MLPEKEQLLSHMKNLVRAPDLLDQSDFEAVLYEIKSNRNWPLGRLFTLRSVHANKEEMRTSV